MYPLSALLVMNLITSVMSQDPPPPKAPPSIGITEPTRYVLLNAQEYEITIKQCEFVNDPLLKFTAFCFCFGAPESAVCSVPGPTLIMHAGSVVKITFYNELLGDEAVQSELANIQYKDIGITNIHTHGLHVNPEEDDITIQIPPNGGQVTYTITIPADHYPGSHWIHPHHHGSSSFQLSMGLFLMLIIEYDPETALYSSQNVVLQYANTAERMKDSVLILQSVYAVNEADCDCDNRADFTQCVEDECTEQLLDPNLVLSLCFEYCDFSEAQRAYYAYDMETVANNYIFHLVNGFLEPMLTIYAGEYHRLRLLNTNTQQTVQLSLPTDCEWKLLALDGIYLHQNTPRDIGVATSYGGQLVLFSATRADVAVKCASEGTYQVKTSHEDLTFGDYSVHQLRRVDADRLMFTVKVIEGTGNNVDDISSLTFPDKPQYLTDNCDDDSVEAITVCPCAEMDKEHMSEDRLVPFPSDDDCIAAFGLDGGAYFNGMTFDITKPNNVWGLNRVYEVTVYSAGHPYHQHIYPFQVQTEDNLFFGEQCDWRDTYGYTDEAHGVFTLRTRPTDFAGVVMEHCHWLPHEDYGMMGWKYITDNEELEIMLDECSVSSAASVGDISGLDINVPHSWDISHVTEDNSVFYRGVIVMLCVVILVVVSWNIMLLNKAKRNKKYAEVSSEEDSADDVL